MLADRDFEVVQHMNDDLDEIKEGVGVPLGERSCHTNEIAGYFVEGHVPIEAIDDLLETRPDVDGPASSAATDRALRLQPSRTDDPRLRRGSSPF